MEPPLIKQPCSKFIANRGPSSLSRGCIKMSMHPAMLNANQTEHNRKFPESAPILEKNSIRRGYPPRGVMILTANAFMLFLPIAMLPQTLPTYVVGLGGSVQDVALQFSAASSATTVALLLLPQLLQGRSMLNVFYFLHASRTISGLLFVASYFGPQPLHILLISRVAHGFTAMQGPLTLVWVGINGSNIQEVSSCVAYVYMANALAALVAPDLVLLPSMLLPTESGLVNDMTALLPGILTVVFSVSGAVPLLIEFGSSTSLFCVDLHVSLHDRSRKRRLPPRALPWAVIFASCFQFCIGSLMASWNESLLVLVLHSAYGWSQADSSWLFSPLAISGIVATLMAQRLLEQYSLLAVARSSHLMFLMVFFMVPWPDHWLQPVSAPILLTGMLVYKVADTTVNLVVSCALLASLPAERQATFNTYCHMFVQIGYMLGPLLASAVYSWAVNDDIWCLSTHSAGIVILGFIEHSVLFCAGYKIFSLGTS